MTTSLILNTIAQSTEKTVLSSTPAASELSGSGQGNDGAEMLNIFLTWVSANYGILILIIIAIIGMSL